MNRRNLIWAGVIVALLGVSLAVVFPLDEGLIGGRGISLGLDLQGGTQLVYQADLSSVTAEDVDDTMQGVAAVLSNRVNPLGVSEPVIEVLGDDRISIQLPGATLTEDQKERLGRVAILEFGELAAQGEDYKWENELGLWKPATAVVDGVEKALTSSYFKENTRVARDEYGGIALVFEWNEEGSRLSEEITTRLQGKRLGIFEGDETLRGDDGQPIAPVVNDVITTSGQITGLSLNEALELSSQLNAGRLPVPLEIVYESTVSPTLGASFVELGMIAGMVALGLVALFMLLYYRLPGLIASIALGFYAALVLALFKLIPVTLTLAGIGGFILSLGMAVDANVLIFERLKEELNSGRTLGAAVDAGFDRAWSAIRDSNITTFIVCIILYWVGSSVVGGAAVKGFSLTLFIGVAVSMFTAIVVTRTLLRLVGGTRLARRRSLFSPYLVQK